MTIWEVCTTWGVTVALFSSEEAAAAYIAETNETTQDMAAPILLEVPLPISVDAPRPVRMRHHVELGRDGRVLDHTQIPFWDIPGNEVQGREWVRGRTYGATVAAEALTYERALKLARERLAEIKQLEVDEEAQITQA